VPVAVFAADVKGNLSDLAVRGDETSPLAERMGKFGRTFTVDRFPAL
jgi:hypothetical protein